MRLVAYLRDAGRIDADERRPRCRVLAGGVSNQTVLVERDSGRGVGAQAGAGEAAGRGRLVQRPGADPPRGAGAALARRSSRPPGAITPLVFEDHEHHLLAMEAVPQPHENWKIDAARRAAGRDHVEQFGELLGHDPPPRLGAAGTSWPRSSTTERFFESLRLEPYYEYTAKQVPEAAPFLASRLVDDTRAPRDHARARRLQPEERPGPRGRLVLLDHEVIHWGDPAFDLGFGADAPAQQGPPPAVGIERRSRTAPFAFWHAYRGRSRRTWTGPTTSNRERSGTRWAACWPGRGSLAAGVPRPGRTQRQAAGAC